MGSKLVSFFKSTNFMRAYLLTLFLLLISTTPSLGLSFDFYVASCPTVELLVKNAVRSASSMDSTLPPKLLRLLFHDCMVEGCDGSVLVEGNATERSDPANASLDGLSLIESIKGLLEVICPGTVSCADILAMAARDAVELVGGPSVQMPMGRRDGRVSSASNVRSNTVDTSFTLNQMVQLFTTKGLSVDDLVILSGAHTIGSAHCSAFSERFQEGPDGKLRLIDDSLDKAYAAQLIRQCPTGASESTTVSNDPETPSAFDNHYYKNLLLAKGLFQSDSVLFNDARTREKVEEFAENQKSFFDGWSESFIKLTLVDVKTGDEGEIRRVCNSING